MVYLPDWALWGPLLVMDVAANGRLVCDGYEEEKVTAQAGLCFAVERRPHGRPEQFDMGDLALWDEWESTLIPREPVK